MKNRSASSVKLDPIHRKGAKKTKKAKSQPQLHQEVAKEAAPEDTDEGFCSNGSSSSSTSHVLLGQ